MDVGCGTGNAALLAAERGARVIGVDPAERLLEVASDRARAGGLKARFIRGEAGSLPLPDASADVLVSVFGVIFAPDAGAAAAEMARAVRSGGRIVLSAWLPDGALFDVMRARAEALAGDTPVAPAPFAWHDRDALSGAFAPHGFSLELREERLAFSGRSPADFLESEFRNHPLWIGTRAELEPRGEMEALRDRALEILEAGNEERGGFRLTSRYVIAIMRRRSAGASRPAGQAGRSAGT